MLILSDRALKDTAKFSRPLTRLRRMRNHDEQPLYFFFWILTPEFCFYHS
jgi:hypothetical protein